MPVEIRCPIDSTKFMITKVLSMTVFERMKDFQQKGAIGEYYEVMINSCPKCHYSGYRADFDTTFNEQTIIEIGDILEEFKVDQMNDVLEIEIAARIHYYFNAKSDKLANLYLMGSYYLKFDTSQVTKRKEIQTTCISYYLKAIENDEYDIKTLATIYYLVGELYRRTNKFDDAIRFFDLALMNEDKYDWIILTATEQKEMAIKKDSNNEI